MIDRFVENFADKLILLETKTGAHVSYKLMTPFSALLHDYVSIQVAAKKIADFIGLSGLTFVIGVAKQGENVAGRVDLGNHGNAVFIDISDETMAFPGAVAVTLCHELCHKWLQINGIRSEPEADNEILTDVTTIFLGLGKIMLNGCIAAKETQETTPIGTRTISGTIKSGYLDREQLAFVYRLVCAMRRVPPSEYLSELHPDAVQALGDCNASFGQCFDSRFHVPETTQELVDLLQKRIVALQVDFAELEKNVGYLMLCCETADGFITKGHKRLGLLLREFKEIAEQPDPDPALNFLRTLKCRCRLDQVDGELQTLGQDTNFYLRHLNAAGSFLHENPEHFPPIPSVFNITRCRQDGTKLRVPEESANMLVTCPTCKYRFAYNTTPLRFRDASTRVTASSTGHLDPTKGREAEVKSKLPPAQREARSKGARLGRLLRVLGINRKARSLF